MKTMFSWLLVGLLGIPFVGRAEDAPAAAPTSRLVERIQDKAGRKLSPLATAKIVEAEKAAAENLKKAHAAYLKQVAAATGFTEQGVEAMVTAEELSKSDADKTLITALEGDLRRALKTTERRGVVRAVRERKQAVGPAQDKLAQTVSMYSGLRRDQVEDVLKGD